MPKQINITVEAKEAIHLYCFMQSCIKIVEMSSKDHEIEMMVRLAVIKRFMVTLEKQLDEKIDIKDLFEMWKELQE